MKQLYRSIIIITVLTTVNCLAQTKITPYQAKDNIGKVVVVSGTADQVTHTRTGTWFINMGGKYPKNAFNGVIFKSDAGKFKDLDKLEGKTVEIKGKIKEYEGTPEIILNDSDQLKIVSEGKK